MENLEKKYRDVLRIGYTQMQEAVPSSYGLLFSMYNDALSRDWWRISKCMERLKVINLGGSAIGTGIAVPRYFIMEVASNLQKITSLPLTRSENMCDATSNLDKYVEVHATLKAHAVNLEKMANDIRLLASDLCHSGEFSIPHKQIGSSIMPTKVNPVIVEFVISAVHKIYANDNLISTLAAQGCLELNAYLPAIGQAFLESIKLLIGINQSFRTNLVDGIKIDVEKAHRNIEKSPSLTTILVPYIGYYNASKIAIIMRDEELTIFEANLKLKLIDQDKLKQLIHPQNLLKMGFSIHDISER